MALPMESTSLEGLILQFVSADPVDPLRSIERTIRRPCVDQSGWGSDRSMRRPLK